MAFPSSGSTRPLFLLPLLIAHVACSSSGDGSASDGDAGGDAGGDGSVACAPLPDLMTAERAACSFAAGSLATETLGLTEAQRESIPVEHIIVVMKENRSFDHLLGKIAEAGQPDADGIPDAFTNPDTNGDPVAPSHLTSTCLPNDPDHQWDAMHAQVNGGAMDGFVTNAAATTTTDGRFAMGYYDETDLPFYYWVAKTFALADRYFPSVLSGTWANRDYLYLGTSDGVKNTLSDGFPSDTLPTLFTRMDDASVTWTAYTDSAPLSFSLGWGGQHAGVKTMADLFDDLSRDALPQVAFIDGRINEEDDHPPADLQLGEAWFRDIYQATVASDVWPTTVLFFTYDEAGGFADHVPPPERSCVARPEDAEFFELGIRVPLVAISPFAKRHFVSHVQHEHTSVTRFIELVFDLPALTARDANSDALLDMFDFECPDDTALPEAPPAGTGGCVAP